MPKTEIVFKDKCGKCGAVRIDNQLGLEPTIEEYIAKMTVVFREVRRVLKDTGTLWLNMGDGYNSANTHSGSADKVDWTVRLGQPAGTTKELKPKDLIGQPWRLAFALQADGWYLRSDIIWHKSNPMPESVTDRPTKSHEYLFLMSKQAKYFYDADAVREEHSREYKVGMDGGSGRDGGRYQGQGGFLESLPNSAGRNKRTVWSIATQPYPEAHFATFPEKLVEPCIRAGTSERGYCAECGLPWVRVVDIQYTDAHRGMVGNQKKVITDNHIMQSGRENDKRMDKNITTIGWQPTCACSADTVPGLVLDPFFGSGTVGVVAAQNGRNWLGIELNPEYIKLAKKRIPTRQEQLIF